MVNVRSKHGFVLVEGLPAPAHTEPEMLAFLALVLSVPAPGELGRQVGSYTLRLVDRGLQNESLIVYRLLQ